MNVIITGEVNIGKSTVTKAVECPVNLTNRPFLAKKIFKAIKKGCPFYSL